MELEFRKSAEALVSVSLTVGRYVVGIESEPYHDIDLANRRMIASEHIRSLGMVESTNKPKAFQSYLDIESS